MSLVHNNKYVISNVDTDALALWHQGINSYGAEHAPIRFQVFMG